MVQDHHQHSLANLFFVYEPNSSKATYNVKPIDEMSAKLLAVLGVLALVSLSGESLARMVRDGQGKRVERPGQLDIGRRSERLSIVLQESRLRTMRFHRKRNCVQTRRQGNCSGCRREKTIAET